MDSSTSWSSEGIGLVKSMEEKKALVNNRVEKPKALNCPRCDSSNTKFCYYNNYNLSQPRYFCKTCRRYWTAGGTLRNVPVGGGSRKINKRSSKTTTNHRDHIMIPQPPPSLSNMVLQSPNEDQHIIPNTNIMNGDQGHLIGFFKNGNNNDYAKGMMMMNSFMPSNTMMMTMMMNNSPNGFENDHDDQDNTKVVSATTTTTAAPSTSARMFFPLDDLKPTPTSENEVQLGDSNCNAYWSGGGSAW